MFDLKHSSNIEEQTSIDMKFFKTTATVKR